MFSSMNPREIIQCPWGFGLHLMGGCAIGTDGAKSVVDPEFRIHDHPNLYIADGGVFPNAPGINPALTIMALTHRMTEGILANGRTA
jgi:choline dehydrogenase-like flavoprotein